MTDSPANPGDIILQFTVRKAEANDVDSIVEAHDSITPRQAQLLLFEAVLQLQDRQWRERLEQLAPQLADGIIEVIDADRQRRWYRRAWRWVWTGVKDALRWMS